MKYLKAFKLSLIGLVIILVTHFASAQGTTPPQFTITWVGPTNYIDGTPIGTAAITYQLYAGAGSGKEAKLGSPVTSPPYVITPSPSPGTNECVQITAIVNGVESAKSAEACATMPFPAPTSPTVVTITIK